MIASFQDSSTFKITDGDYDGYFGGVFKELLRVMNFTVSEILWHDSSGRWDPETSNWTGAIGSIYRGEGDLGVAGFFMEGDRYRAVSFTSPLLIGNLQLYLKKDHIRSLEWDAHFKVLMNYMFFLFTLF